ncbi:dihydroxyacetone kinase 1 [Auriscalpium vulgare]|uniref:Dihydroxyacetone kinase 1 n=1 Tax=Auriscalpium vulgare TaxID=40419 RepID=A0ACB8RTF1_9AGAM|nr:dihydroxyacetone kinase 1 [Auriscalpium vulgare]
MGVQTKHFLNSPGSLVLESLEGLCAVNPQLSLDSANKVVHLTEQDKSKVALICGGGSGHEPSHAGFVGQGMLTAAVCGNVFASPGPNQVRRGIELTDNDKGTLIIVKNYTGDVLNFGLAKEQYAAQHATKAEHVKFLVVGDDVAVGKTQGSIVGRRGLAGTVLVYKIAGALAREGASLDKVYEVAEFVANNIATVGVGLEHCHVPGTASGEGHLKNTEIEIGMGIHNEPGAQRVSPVPSLHELVAQLLDLLLSTTDSERSFLPVNGQDDEVVLLVNNLGGLSELELGGIVREVEKSLGGRSIRVQRVLAGTFMTSLNMPGFSLTLLLLPKNSSKEYSADVILRLLDASTSAPGWKWHSASPPSTLTATQQAKPAPPLKAGQSTTLRVADPKALTAVIERVCAALNQNEAEITRMDTIAGDGDCGLTLQNGANGVLQQLRDGNVSGNDVVGSLIVMSEVAAEKMGGTSGALFSIFFSALAQGLTTAASGSGTATAQHWAQALSLALQKLYTYTRARPPSRTLVDPLAAFVTALEGDASDVGSAVQKAAQAAEHTRDVEARAGRSAYVEGNLLKRERVPDPGAWGIKVILEAVAST